MSSRRTEILEEYVLSDPSICTRCFSSTMSTKERSGGFSGGAPCSEDECGKIGISMEDTTVAENTIRARSHNLYHLLQNNEVEISEEKFYKAAQAFATAFPPKQVFLKAIGHGIGELDPDELPEWGSAEEYHESNDGQSTNDEQEDYTAADVLSQHPLPETAVDDRIPDDIMSHLSRLEVPGAETTADIYYIANPEQFATEFDVDSSDISGYESVINAAVNWNWDRLEGFSSGTIRSWIEETKELSPDYVLDAAIRRGVRDQPRVIYDDDARHSFRDSGFWPLVKQNKSQVIAGNLRGAREPVTSAELADMVGEDEDIVEKLLIVLNHGEYVDYRYQDQKWEYVEQ